MSSNAYAEYQKAVARILRYGLATLPGEPTPRLTCDTCGKTKDAAEFHPDSLLWGTLCLVCWIALPGQHGPQER
jgi:hypothetical protein